MARAYRKTEEHTFAPIEDGGAPAEHLDLEDLYDAKLVIHAELGQCRMRVHDILELREGSVVQLGKQAGESTDIFINNMPLAKGEVVVIGDSLHVRIGEITGTAERREEDDEA